MKFLLKFIFSMALIGVIIWYLGGLGQVGQLMAQMSPWYVLLLFLLLTFDRALMTFKWTRLLRGRGLHLPFFLGMKIYCASAIWGMFLPSTIGADAIRAFSISRRGFNADQIITSIIIERIIGFMSALLLGVISLALLFHLGSLGPEFDFIWWVGSATLIGTMGAFAASFSQWGFDFLHDQLLYRFRDRWIMQRLQKFHSIYLGYQNDKLRLLIFFVWTFIEQCTPILSTWLIAQGMGIEVGPLYIAGVVPLSLLISRIPISIDGLGVFDGIFMLLMSLIGVPAPQAIAMTLTGRIIQILSLLPWWIIQVIGAGSFRTPQPVR